VTDPPNGRLPPLTAGARAKAAAGAADNGAHPADGPENRSLQERCLSFNAGPPMLPGPYNNYVQIFQMPGYAIILNEMIHDARVVPLDGRPHGTGRRWMGDSVGHWEGSTLVVDTVNFTDKTSVRGSDQSLHLIERFTRTGPDTMEYRFTMDDPTIWTRTWTAAVPLTRTDEAMYEYACHEGNARSVEGMLRGARVQDTNPR